MGKTKQHCMQAEPEMTPNKDTCYQFAQLQRKFQLFTPSRAHSLETENTSAISALFPNKRSYEVRKLPTRKPTTKIDNQCSTTAEFKSCLPYTSRKANTICPVKPILNTQASPVRPGIFVPDTPATSVDYTVRLSHTKRFGSETKQMHPSEMTVLEEICGFDDLCERCPKEKPLKRAAVGIQDKTTEVHFEYFFILE